MKDLTEVLNMFRKFRLKLTPEKCVFRIAAGNVLALWCLKQE